MNNNELTDKTDAAVNLGDEAEFSVGAMLVRPAAREIVIDGRVETIEPRVMQALVALARVRGEVISRDKLVEACWGGRVVSEDAITRCMVKVRRLAAPNTFELETIPRVGYRLLSCAETPAAQAQAGIQAAPIASGTRTPKRRKALAVVLSVIAFLTVGTGYWTWRVMEAMGASTFAELGALMDVSSRPRFAVLPFDATGSHADTGYLADAIPTAINNQLTSLGFQVVSPAVAMQYRGERKALAASELDPRYIIDGSLRVEGESVRVTLRVDSAAQRVSLWSRDFSADVREVSDLPSRIATTLAGLTIFSTTTRSIGSNPSTITAGMMRMTELSQAGDEMGAYVLSKELLRAAPNAVMYQGYYAILTAEALDLLPSGERVAAITDARRVAGEAATMAIWGAPVARQAVMHPTDWAAREAVLRKALKGDFQVVGIRYTLAGILASTGRIEESKNVAREAVALDPLIPSNSLMFATALDIGGDLEEAAAILSRAQRLWPQREWFELQRFTHAIGKGDLQSAAAMLDNPIVKATLEPPAERQPFESIVRALKTQNPIDIAAVETQCADPSKLSRRRGGVCLLALAKLNRLDTFFEVSKVYFPEQRGKSSVERDQRWLENPFAWRTLRVLFREDLPALRTDDRFIPIAERMGLLDFWKATGNWPDFCRSEPKSVCEKMRKQ